MAAVGFIGRDVVGNGDTGLDVAGVWGVEVDLSSFLCPGHGKFSGETENKYAVNRQKEGGSHVSVYCVGSKNITY